MLKGKMEKEEIKMKKIILVLLCTVILISCAACDKEEQTTEDKVYFSATVIDTFEGGVLVEPDENTSERKSSDRITVSFSKPENVPELKAGDRVGIYHNGQILESYPAQLHKVYSVVKIEQKR